MANNGIVQKLWNYCNVLATTGSRMETYVEQLTFLLFLKMADELTRPPFNKPSAIPKGYDWPSLLDLEGDALEIHYRHLLETLAKERGTGEGERVFAEDVWVGLAVLPRGFRWSLVC